MGSTASWFLVELGVSMVSRAKRALVELGLRRMACQGRVRGTQGGWLAKIGCGERRVAGLPRQGLGNAGWPAFQGRVWGMQGGRLAKAVWRAWSLGRGLTQHCTLAALHKTK